MTESFTAQEIFDRVATHLLKQGESSRSNGGCWYRGPGDLRCAVGCLIPDDVYSPEMENKDVRRLLEIYKALSHLRPHTGLLDELQQIHDHCIEKNWPDALRALAHTRGLDAAVLQQVSK